MPGIEPGAAGWKETVLSIVLCFLFVLLENFHKKLAREKSYDNLKKLPGQLVSSPTADRDLD